nr:zinc finger, CCHC-type [Tanacetum cinerariifolium]
MAQENYVEGCSMQVIQNGDFVFMIEDPELKIEVETPYELLKDDQRKQLDKNNEDKMTLYNALPRKEANVTTIEEAKYLATLPLDELIGNLKVYEMILNNDGVASKTTKEKVKSLALKAKITTEQTSDESDNQEESDKEEKDEANEFNLMVRNFRKFFRKADRFRRGNRFGNAGNRFRKGRGNGYGNKGNISSRQKREYYICGEEGHFIGLDLVDFGSTSRISVQSNSVETLDPPSDFRFSFRAWIWELILVVFTLQRIVLSIDDKLNYLEQSIPPTLVAPKGQQVAPEIIAAHIAWIKGSKEIAELMLMNMKPEIQRNLENLHAHEMLQELKTLFSQQAEQE